jgi:hypothetical protein
MRAAGRVSLERIPYDAGSWAEVLDRYPNADVFHSPEWLQFLALSQQAEPVLAVVRLGAEPVGHFVGAMVRRAGLRILGSPLRGWSTESMGFLLEDENLRRAAAEALAAFAFDDLGCVHVELADKHLSAQDMAGSGFASEIGRTYRIDLRPPEDDVFRAVRRTTRQEVRKGVRAGLRVEEGADTEFAAEFYGYLTQIFQRQGLAPTYSRERVEQLIGALQSSGQILLLRVRSPAGATLGTSISVGRNQAAIGWGMAFDRENREYHAIELLWWETIRRWKAAGALQFDLGGGGDYKAKYGAAEVPTLWLHRSRFRVLRYGRTSVRTLFRLRQVLAGRRTRAAIDPATR